MSQLQEKIRQAGDFVLEKCEIESYLTKDSKPKTVNIVPIISSIELTENIFDTCMVGRIQVYDSQDIRTVLPITGFEKLNLKFQTPGQTGVDHTEENGRQFHIYKIESVNQDTGGQRTQGYDIFFTSKEYYYNFLTKVSKAYEGPIELAIDDILRNKKYLNSTRSFIFEPTSTNAKYVIPSLRPFDAIKYLCTQSVSKKYKNAGYVFYETPAGYFFRSLESMYAVDGSAGRPYKFKYYYQIMNSGHGDVEKDMHGVMDWKINNTANTLENMDMGMYANRLTVHDAFNKTVRKYDFDYRKSFGDYFHVETVDGNRTYIKQLSPYVPFDDTKKEVSQFPESRTMVVTETSKVHNNYEFTPTKDTLPIQASQLQSLHNNILTLTVHGNSLLGAGDIIHFETPVLKPLNEKKTEEVNPYLSGRFLVTAIKHTISRDIGKYEMTLKCSKDAVANAYVYERDAYQNNKEEPKTYNIYEEDKAIMAGLDISPLDYT